MKKTLALLLLSIPASLPGQRFASDFRDKTMRIDYFHTGGMGSEIVSVDRIVSDGPWPGSTTHLLDSTGLGKYRFEVQDSATGRPLFSKGLASIYGEWETTDEAARTHKTFSASLRFTGSLLMCRLSALKPAETLRRYSTRALTPDSS